MHVVMYYVVRSRMETNHVCGLTVLEMQANVFSGCLNQCVSAETQVLVCSFINVLS